MEYTTIEKMAIVFFLNKIMEADSIIDRREVEFMDAMYERLSVVDTELSLLEMMDLEFCKGIISAMDPEKLENARQLFVGMALSDGYYDPAERTLIESL